MAKLEPIKIQKGDSLTDIFNKCHEVFRNTIAAKDRPLLDGKQIYVPIRWIENKAEIFEASGYFVGKIPACGYN